MDSCSWHFCFIVSYTGARRDGVYIFIFVTELTFLFFYVLQILGLVFWEGGRATYRQGGEIYVSFKKLLFDEIICIQHLWEGEILCIRHRWEGEMSSSQYKSPHQTRALRRGFHVVTCAEMSPSPYQRCGMYFLVRISILSSKSKLSREAYRRECEMG